MDSGVMKVGFALVLVVLIAVYALDDLMQNPTTQTTASTTTSTPVMATTTTNPDPNALPECLLMDTQCKRDRCYFGNALNRHETVLCGQIESPNLRESCINKMWSNETTGEATIEGQVFNTRNCGAYGNLTVEVRDMDDKTIASGKTNNNGEYLFKVPAGGDYGIYVTIVDSVLNQNLEEVTARRYIVDFALS